MQCSLPWSSNKIILLFKTIYILCFFSFVVRAIQGCQEFLVTLACKEHLWVSKTPPLFNAKLQFFELECLHVNQYFKINWTGELHMLQDILQYMLFAYFCWVFKKFSPRMYFLKLDKVRSLTLLPLAFLYCNKNKIHSKAIIPTDQGLELDYVSYIFHHLRFYTFPDLRKNIWVTMWS